MQDPATSTDKYYCDVEESTVSRKMIIDVKSLVDNSVFIIIKSVETNLIDGIDNTDLC